MVDDPPIVVPGFYPIRADMLTSEIIGDLQTYFDGLDREDDGTEAAG